MMFYQNWPVQGKNMVSGIKDSNKKITNNYNKIYTWNKYVKM